MARPAMSYLVAPVAIVAVVVALSIAFLGASPAAAAGATVTVQKTTHPSGDAQVFNIQLTGPVNQNGTVTDASDFVFTNLPAGTYTLTETVPGGWEFDSFGCSDGGNSMTFDLIDVDDITCTFENTKLGTIIVQKTTNPSGSPQSFPINLSGPTPGSGFISDSFDANFPNRSPGSYTITETVPSGWSNSTVDCFGAETSSGPGTVDIDVGPGQAVTCIFSNETTAEFMVSKDFQPDNPSSVMVTVNCTSGTSSPPDNVDESGPVSFIITGYSGNPLCTATESGVPPGYTTSSCQALLSAGGCTIVNTQATGTPTPTPSPGTPSPTPSPTALPSTQTPNPVGGFVDVTTSSPGGGSMLFVLVSGLLAIAMAGAAVFGFRRASIRR